MSYNINGADILTYMSPVGCVIAYTGVTDPSNWLICDGRAVNRISYKNLFSTIDTKFGSGDNSTTFNIPNYKGAFLRGTGTDPTSTYTGPSINTSQHMGIMQHNHDINDPEHTHTDSGHTHRLDVHYNYDDCDSNQHVIGNTWEDHWGVDHPQMYTDSGKANISSNSTGITIKSNSVTSTTTSYGTTETRPYNYGINWIIRY
jgi:microcystin-dependent protein